LTGSRNKLDQAISDFREKITSLTGGYATLEDNGFWSRFFPGDKPYVATKTFDERIRVASGCVSVYERNHVHWLRKGDSLVIPKGIQYEIVPFGDGAHIEFKFM
jgi:uncharacterized cupin superfamily protein